MGELVYLVGLPGSGKSTMALSFEKKGYKVFSSDAIREELYGDASIQSDPQKVFRVLHKRVKDALRAGENCVYDATNVRSKNRIAFLKEIQNIKCKKICCIVWASIDTCKERNVSRERKVPDYVIERMWRQFETPYYFEGWDDIRIVCSENINKVYENFLKNFLSSWNFSQDNSHHTLSLGEHCQQAFSKTKSLDSSIKFAAFYHDYGKLFTKTFYNKKGELDKEAHYYDHQNVGAYETLVVSDGLNTLKISALICYHMHPYFWKNNPKMEEKYKQLWGEEFYNEILLIHEADMAAH